MSLDSPELVRKLLTFFVPTLFSLALHEFGHAASAVALGDQTPKEQGRLSLNPIVHVDMLGTVILPLVLIVMGQAPFGWAKPVVITPYRFTRRIAMRTGLMLTAAAGPAMNLLLALACALGAAAGEHYGVMPGGARTVLMLREAVVLNVMLFLFNLLPVPPLDGSRVLAGMMPLKLRGMYTELERVSPLLLGVLFFSGAGASVIGRPTVSLVEGLGRFARAVFP